MENISIITVVFKDDHANLLYQAYSLKKNWQGTKAWAIIPEDDGISRQFITETILPIMEGWVMRVPAIPDIFTRPGWWRQQVLKLWAAGTLASRYKYSLILDAKNFLIDPIDESWFFVDGKQKIQAFMPNEGYDTTTYPYYREACTFFNKNPNLHCWPTTPWLWENKLVQTTIHAYKTNGVDIFSDMHIPAWEFFAYWIVNCDNINFYPEWQKFDLDIDEVVRGSANRYREFRFLTYHRNKSSLYYSNVVNGILLERNVITQSIIEKRYSIDELASTNRNTDTTIYMYGEGLINLDFDYLSKAVEPLKVSINNRSVAHQSNQTTCAKIVNDINDLTKEIAPSDILIIIGLTSCNQFKLPYNDRISSYSIDNNKSESANSLVKFDSEIVGHIDTSYLFIENCINILGVAQFLKKLNIPYVFVATPNWHKSIENFNLAANQHLSLIELEPIINVPCDYSTDINELNMQFFHIITSLVSSVKF